MFFLATTSVYPRLFNFFFYYNSTKIAFLQVAQLTYMTKVSQGLAIISDENSKDLITYLILSGEAAAKRVNTSVTRRGCESLPARRVRKEKASGASRFLLIKQNQSLQHYKHVRSYFTAPDLILSFAIWAIVWTSSAGNSHRLVLENFNRGKSFFKNYYYN